MKLSKTEIHTIAGLLRDKDRHNDSIAKKKLTENPSINKKAKEYFTAFSKLPKEFQSMLKIHYSDSVTLKHIEGKLIDKIQFKKTEKSLDVYDLKVSLTALECKDIRELKQKLKIEF